MYSSFLFSSYKSPLTLKKPINYPTSLPHHHLLSTPHYITFNKREIVSPISITSPSISYPQPPINVNYLEKEFGRHGVTFTELGSNYVIKMVLENGSAASILMPSGLITSYKPKMWHGSSTEVLHTCVSETRNSNIQGGGPIIQGGVSLDLDCKGDNGYLWSPVCWTLYYVKGSSEDSIQVEIVSRDSANTVEVKYIITLKNDTMISDVTVSNSRSSQLDITGSILSHLTVSTPDATYAFGLERSNFTNKQPLISDFSIIPSNLTKNKETSLNESWPLSSLKEFFAAKGDVKEEEEETVGEEDDNYKHLSDKMSRIYTSAPRNFTIIDRGKRNSVMIGRKGFEELYMYSPGSSHESYGKYAYICVGQSAILRPVRLGPQKVWRGEQHLHNPNL